MKKIILIIFLLLAGTMQAQLLDVFSKPKIVNTTWYSLDLDGSTEYASKTSPLGLDLNSANYLSGDNTAFTTTVGDWVDNGDVSSSIASSSLQMVASGATSSDYISLAQTYLSSSWVDGLNYTIQLSAKSAASSGFTVYVGTHLVATFTTTTSAVIKAITFTYDNSWGTEIRIYPLVADTYTFDNVDVSEAYDLSIEGWFKTNNKSLRQGLFDFSDGKYYLGLRSGVLRFTVWDSPSSFNIYGDAPVDSVWTQFKLKHNRASGFVSTGYTNYTDSTSLAGYKPPSISKFSIGVESVTNYFNGQIGKITITRTNGLGEVTGTSIYDWSGDASTFLKDKGTLGNDLTGTNITTDDVNSWTSNYTEAK